MPQIVVDLARSKAVTRKQSHSVVTQQIDEQSLRRSPCSSRAVWPRLARVITARIIVAIAPAVSA